MIRLIIFAVAVFLIWVLFFSGYEKRQKMIITVMSLLLCLAGVIFESEIKQPRSNRIAVNQVTSCGVTAVAGYRSNYDFSICLTNTASGASVKRVALIIVAEQCATDSNCEQIQSVNRSLLVDIAPQDSLTFQENLSFDLVDQTAENIQWRVEVMSVKAL